MADHPDPLGDTEHWVTGDSVLHATEPNAVSPCGFEDGQAVHYRQLKGTREEFDICPDCRDAVEGGED